MSFNVSVKEAPATPATPAGPQSGADRAKAMLQASMQQPPQPAPGTPPINNSNVAMEDYSAAHPAKPPVSAEGSQDNTTEATPPEPAPPAATVTEEGDKAPALSAKYAQLAKQEKAFRAAQAKFKADQAAFKAAQDAAKAPAPTLYDSARHVDRDALKTDPFKVLAELGLTYDQLTAQAMNAPTPEQVQSQQTINELRQEIQNLKQAQERVNKTLEEAPQQSYQQAVNQIRADVRRLVSSDPAFETIKETGSINDVVELIEKTFKEDRDEYGNPVLLTVDEAAKLVEDELSDRLYSYANKIEKVKKRFAPSPAPAATKTEQKLQTEPKQPQRPTLTNAIGTSGKLSAKERAVLAGKFGPDWREKVGT